MKIALECRFKKLVLTEEQKAQQEAQRIINGNDELGSFDPDDETFDYAELVLDTKDIRGFNMIDKDHSLIRTYQLESYVVKIPYKLFCEFYQQVTGELIQRAKYR